MGMWVGIGRKARRCYGFDEIATNGTVYGKEWRYYFGVTFGYLD